MNRFFFLDGSGWVAGLSEITARSPAKANLVLDVLRKRLDGFHDVDSVMQELELHDTITVREADSGIRIRCNRPEVPLNESNLCWKAARLVQEETGISTGLDIALEKPFPTSSGLGSGSSNAVAVLKSLNQLWKLNVSTLQLMDWSARLGSDCAFFVRGGTQRARGRGELLAPLPKCPELHVVLAFPKIELKSKTALLYSQLDLNRVQRRARVDRMVQALESSDAKSVASAMGNIFEECAIPAYAALLRKLSDWKRDDRVLNAVLCGAGPTLLAACESQRAANEFAEELERDSLWSQVTASRTV